MRALWNSNNTYPKTTMERPISGVETISSHSAHLVIYFHGLGRGTWGFAVLMFFWCGDAVNKVSICGVAVISNLTVCDVCVFHAAVFGEMNICGAVVSCVIFSKVPLMKLLPSSTGRNQIATLYCAGLGFGLWSRRATAKSAPLALISANSAMVCLFCGKLFRNRSMTLSVDIKII